MKPRLTAWLLTVLLSLAGGFGVPTASNAIPRSSYSVVWPDKSAKPQSPQQEIAESRESALPLRAASLPDLPKNEDRAAAALLDPALFQRPPPCLPSRP